MTDPMRPTPVARPRWPQRLGAAWAYLRAAEPARLIAVWRALLGVLIALGATVPEWIDVRVAGTVSAVYVLLAVWQGEATRARVYAPANVYVEPTQPVYQPPE